MKKVISLMLALGMMLTIALPSSPFVVALGDQSNGNITANTLGITSVGATSVDGATPEALSLVEMLSNLPQLEAVEEMTPEEIDVLVLSLAEAMEVYEGLTPEEMAFLESQYPELLETFLTFMEALNSDIGLLSLRPMPETDAYLTLYGLTKEQLQNYPVDQLIQQMTTETGEPIVVDSGYTSAWFYIDDYSANAGTDELRMLNQGETIDLWDYSARDDYYSYSSMIYLVLGNGNQLADSTQQHRYCIEVNSVRKKQLLLPLPNYEVLHWRRRKGGNKDRTNF